MRAAFVSSSASASDSLQRMKWAAIAISLTYTSFAYADARSTSGDKTKEECVTGYENSQRLTIDGKLREARKQLLICARDVCPAVTQADCARWLTALDTKMPTVILLAKDANGHDIEVAQVSADGEVLTERLDGLPIAVDPGAHTFRWLEKGRVVEDYTVT